MTDRKIISKDSIIFAVLSGGCLYIGFSGLIEKILDWSTGLTAVFFMLASLLFFLAIVFAIRDVLEYVLPKYFKEIEKE